MNRAVFLDRDGVINIDRPDYVKNLHELMVYPCVVEAIHRLRAAGFIIVVVSNQQGIAKGLIAETDLCRMQDAISATVNGEIEAFYYCKHLASEGCSCRKPEPGMLLQAAIDLDIDLAESFMIGDSETDILAGKAAGCRTLLIEGKRCECEPDHVVDDLLEAAWTVLAQGDLRLLEADDRVFDHQIRASLLMTHPVHPDDCEDAIRYVEAVGNEDYLLADELLHAIRQKPHHQTAKRRYVDVHKDRRHSQRSR